MRRIVLLALALIACSQVPARATTPDDATRQVSTSGKRDKLRAPIVRYDKQFYTKGSYIAYAAPWSSDNKRMKSGEDFLDTITIDAAAFPSRTRISWHWPLVPAKTTGVRGYMALGFGNYDSGLPQAPIEPQQVKNLRAVSQSIDWQYERVAGDFNLLAEFYLTRSAGNSADKVAEIGFMLHTPAATRAWTGTGAALGTWTDALGARWEITRNEGPGIPYIIFTPVGGADFLAGRLDVKGALGELRRLRQITGDEWLNGMALGVEPVSGSGFATVNTWRVHW